MRIIAFTGKKASGKTTATDYLLSKAVEHESGSLQIEKINMKVGIIAEMKEKMDVTLKALSETYGMDIETLFKEKPPLMRALMQDYGLMRRGDDPDYWVKKWAEKVKQSTANVIVVDDVRFPNELEAVFANNGEVYRIKRLGQETTDFHETETALDHIELPTIEARTPEELYAILDEIRL